LSSEVSFDESPTRRRPSNQDLVEVDVQSPPTFSQFMNDSKLIIGMKEIPSKDYRLLTGISRNSNRIVTPNVLTLKPI